MNLENKRVLVTGGTGSLGQVLVRRLLSGELGQPKQVLVFSRDEAKQHYMRLDFQNRKVATDEVIYRNFREILSFRIGDVRDYQSVVRAVRESDVIFNAAALKQVPTCEYFPYEAVLTNVGGAQNLTQAIAENGGHVEFVVGISTDKAAKPINVMGMTKALQERILISANLYNKNTKFMCVRYGNVIASRGSVVPLFVEQIRNGGPVTITMPEMTKFLLSINRAVDTIFAAVREGNAGETYVPKVPSARMVDVARALMGEHEVSITYTGIRPGEKIHEELISEEECFRTIERNNYYVILPMLSEISSPNTEPTLTEAYSSSRDNLDVPQLVELLSHSQEDIMAYTH